MTSLFLAAALLAPQEPNKAEVIKKTFTVSGKFVAFEMGDYVHAYVADKKGKETSFFIGAGGLDFFLAAHSKKPGTFKIQVVEAYIEEAGGRMEIQRMVSARVSGKSSDSWWNAEKRRIGVDKANAKYQPWVDKLTRVPKS